MRKLLFVLALLGLWGVPAVVMPEVRGQSPVAYAASSRVEGFPMRESFKSFKTRVDSYPADIEALKKASVEYKTRYDDLVIPEQINAPLIDRNDKALQLIAARENFRAIYDRLAIVAIGVIQLPNFNLEGSGWTKDQVEESKKWRKFFDPIRKALGSSRKATPDDFEVSLLVYSMNGTWHQ